MEKNVNNKEEVAKRVTQVIAERLGFMVDAVTPEKRLVADMGADSLDLVELAMAIEDEFAIEVNDEEGEEIHTVQQAVDYVLKELSA